MSSSANVERRARFFRRLSGFGERIYANRRRVATVAALAIAVLIGYHVIFGQNGLTVYRNKRHDLRDLQAEGASLQRENAQLQGHVERLTNDPGAIEHQAREDLHYTRPGEVIVTLPNEERKH